MTNNRMDNSKYVNDGKTYYGEVCWFSSKRGLGFISWSIDGVKQTDLFVHYSDINIQGFKTLFKGQRISFKIGINNRGEPKATSVEIQR